MSTPSDTRSQMYEKLKTEPLKILKIQGSSAGAGSGTFHTYRANRNRERQRLEDMETQEAELAEQTEWEQQRAAHKREEEEMHKKKVDKRKRKQENKKKAQLAHKAQKAKSNAAASTTSGTEQHNDADSDDEERKDSAGDAPVAADDKQKEQQKQSHEPEHTADEEKVGEKPTEAKRDTTPPPTATSASTADDTQRSNEEGEANSQDGRSTSISASSRPSFSPWLAAAPAAVLGLICQHLPADDILRLLRSCSALRVLKVEDAAFNAVAWSSAKFKLVLDKRVNEWTLPYDSCVDVSSLERNSQLARWQQADPVMLGQSEHFRRLVECGFITSEDYDEEPEEEPRADRHIPLSMWQQALPILRYTLEQWERDEVTKRVKWPMKGWAKQLKAALTFEQPTTTIRVGEGDCVVLSELSWGKLDKLVPLEAPCFRTHFVLSGVPYLQHLALSIDTSVVGPLPVSSVFYKFVPHLRSLVHGECGDADPVIPIRDMLAALPSLTSLLCVDVSLRVQDMIDVTAHATLERIYLHVSHPLTAYSLTLDSCRPAKKRDPTVVRCGCCHSSEEEDETEDDREVDELVGSMHHAELTEEEAKLDAEDIQRLQRALVRVPPSRRSITARLVVADRLYRWLRARLREARKRQKTIEVRLHYMQQIATLRSTLRDQLASSVSVAEPRSEVVEA